MKKFLSTLLYTAAATLLFSACGMTANTVSSPVEPTVKSNEKTAVSSCLFQQGYQPCKSDQTI